MNAETKICMIVGDPVGHSLSPTMHNAGYESLGLDFVYVGAHVKSAQLGNFANGIRAMNIRGVSCTAPHKIKIMRYLDKIDPIAVQVGAVNTIANDNGMLTGSNTDWIGVLRPLERLTKLKGKRVAIIGTGGVACAALYGLTKRGAQVTVYGRVIKEAKILQKKFGCKIRPLTAILKEAGKADILINATPVGSRASKSKEILPKKYIRKDHTVFDAVYNPHKTKLIKDAEAQGAKVVHGIEMLLEQGVEQFELFTGKKAPRLAMRRALIKGINAYEK